MQKIIHQLHLAIDQVYDEVVEIRRHIHQHPELSFEEFKTSQYVQDKLVSFGIQFTTGWVKTGIVADIQPDKPVDRWIALRADMDALPIQEENEIAYKSVNPGVMHACGHDVHTAMLLGAAKIIQEFRNELTVGVRLIFQPGEEKLPGGAKLMMEEGVLENHPISEIFALHVFSDLDAGKIGVRPGMYMASCDEIRITIKGKGGHGAMPHKNIDPVLISAHTIVALQQVISRNCPPHIPAVLSFGRIEGLGATNVIPNEVKLEGTFRTMDENWREKAHKLIHKLTSELTESMGGTADVKIDVGYPYLENNPELTSLAKIRAIQLVGEENIVDLPLRMTGEDFAYFSQKIPATFIRIGVRDETNDIIHPVHNALFNIDESSMKTGIKTLLSQVFLR
jgi:amidohydrolase